MSNLSQLLASLLSKRRRAWLDDAVIALKDVSFTRYEIATECGIPSTVSAGRLHRALLKHNIRTSKQLYDMGLDGLLAIKGVGEAQAWIAAGLIWKAGHYVAAWVPETKTTKGAIRAAADRKKTKAQRSRSATRRGKGRTTSSQLRLAASR